MFLEQIGLVEASVLKYVFNVMLWVIFLHFYGFSQVESSESRTSDKGFSLRQ